MPRMKIPQEKLDSAIAEREELGTAIWRIASRLHVSTNCLEWHFLRLGVLPPTLSKLRINQGGPRVMRRGSHEVRRFTPEEDAAITEARCAGLTPTQIGRRVNRKSHSIVARLATLARHDQIAEIRRP